MPQIRVKNGPQKGKAFTLSGNKSIRLGRDPACELQIIDKGVSREHAQIFRVGEMVFLRDLGSRNGSFVNEERVTEELLREGDVVRVGVTQLVFESREVPDEAQKLHYEDGDDFRASLDLKLEDLYVYEAAATGREGDLFKAMCQATKLLQSEKDEKKLLERLLALIQEYIPADYVCVFMRDEATGAVTPRAMNPKPDKDNVAISRSILRRVIGDSHAILTSDAMQDERFKGGESIVINNIRAVLCVPIQGTGKQAMGAIYAVNTRLAETFEQVDLQLLSAMGGQLALAVENMQGVRIRRRMFLHTIGRLLSLLEGLPPKQRGHSERVCLYCTSIASEMGLSDSQTMFAGLAGLLHDVGKLPAVSGLSQAASERSQGVATVLAAVEFLKDIPALQDALPGIRSHHERFDGSGVPQQLKGEGIPLLARVLGAANVFDKLVFPNGAERPDADPEPAQVRKAFQQMEQDAGKLFDPQIVRALIIAYRHGALKPVTGDIISSHSGFMQSVIAGDEGSEGLTTTKPMPGDDKSKDPQGAGYESGETIRTNKNKSENSGA